MKLRLTVLTCLVLTALMLVPRAALGQEKYEPHPLSVAIGGEIGFWIPDEHFNFSYTPGGLVELYITSGISVRGQIMWTRPDFVEGGRALDQWRGMVSLSKNWDKGYWHPFLLAGMGTISVQYSVGDGDPVGSRIMQKTFHGGCGVEYFYSPKGTLKFEIRYDWSKPMPDIEASPSGLSLTVGFKKYF